MVISVHTALELDRKQSPNQFTLVEENNTADGSFIILALLEQALKEKNKIILFLCHNSIEHYHAIAQKFGLSILQEVSKGNVVVHDFLQMLSNDNSLLETSESVLKKVYLQLRKTVMETEGDVTLIFDNIGNLLLLGCPVTILLFFVQYCCNLRSEVKNLKVTCLMHNFIRCNDLKRWITYLRHSADLHVMLDDLKTGRAVDVSGKLTVKWRTGDKMMWLEESEYHYQLLDKNVLVFAPGAKNI